MQEFSELKYKRPDMAAVKASYKAVIRSLKGAKSYADAKAALFELQKTDSVLETAYSLAYIRNTANTADKFYETETAFFNKALPSLVGLQKKVTSALLESVYRPEFEAEYGPQLFDTLEADEQLQNILVAPQMVIEANLETKYSKLAASCSCDFKNEKCNFYGLLRHMQSPDRAERKEAFKAFSRLYADKSAELDKIFDKLVAVRTRMAKRLGFSSYVEMAYVKNHRFDYTASDVEAFREQILKNVVPLCAKLREMQTKRIGVDKLHYYDETLMFKDGNPQPDKTPQDMLKCAREMYHALSPDTAEFFDYMLKYGLFDLVTRENKHLGGYMTSLPEYDAPFVFSNFNGTSADVDVLTHECGHAFQYYTCSRFQPLHAYRNSTSEINEIHSMSMEFFAYPWMNRFFGERAAEYRYAHLCESLFVLPYICAVDEFQHRVYADPAPDAAARKSIWRELEKKYLPWRDYDGDEFMESGGFWMQKQHIFLYPFYYIEYALAQICSYQFCGRMKKDFKAAWSDYLLLCNAGGCMGYFGLLGLAKLERPFDEGVVRKSVANIIDQLRAFK